MNNTIKSVGILGMGALGLLYGSQAGTDCVSYIMDNDRAEKYRNAPLRINGNEFKANLVTPDKAFPVDLLIIAVKYNSLSQALETANGFVGENTVIISVMNGIISEEIIEKKFGKEKVVYCIAQGMDAMKTGSQLVYTKHGNLHVGMPTGCCTDNLERVIEFFERKQIPYIREKDIMWRMWFKFMLNVGINQTCMVYNVPYGIATSPGESYRMMVAAMREVRAIAEMEGITLTEEQLAQCIEIEKTLDPTATPSMGQDRILKRKSEVELFAGTVIRYAKKHGILVPANEFFYEKVKEIEAKY